LLKNSLGQNTVQSPLSGKSCSVLHDDRFKVNPSALTSPREIRKAIKRLKSGKALGFDGVPIIILKNMPRTAFVYLAYVFNSCIKLCYFPKIWKHASVIPILKPGKDHSTTPSTYRPIMSSISKVFERIILKRLNGFISTVNILPDHQFGFRVAHSTSHQLRMVGGRRLSTGMLLLNVEKAFDSL
jgi:hypothetical protein